MPYWQLFYHIVWSTKNREPLLSPTVERQVYHHLKTKAIGLGGQVFAINGIADHVHMLVAIPPRIALAQFVGEVKGVASAKYNKQQAQESPKPYWQNDYGIFSFDKKRLPYVRAYVDNQKQHHATNKLIPVLERTDDQGVQIIREADGIYGVNNEDWWTEMLTLDK